MDAEIHQGTKNVGNLFKMQADEVSDPLIGYCNADYASKLYTRKSQIGYVYKLHGVAISWKSTDTVREWNVYRRGDRKQFWPVEESQEAGQQREMNLDAREEEN